MSSPYHTPDPYDGRQNPYANGQPGYGYPQQPPQYGHPQSGYGPGPGYGYPGGPGGPHPTAGEPNQLALASVVLGFISIVGALFCYGGVLGPVSIGLGVAGLARSKRTGTGRNQSIGGIALGALGTAILASFIVLIVVYKKHVAP
ncbi:DUF4190 domain-containing protein [Wenjunlia tyrosinilytica]|uniref:DUF4190 domain-containing protein n=1 Tax=Wenjunlia tyrosinilytica TaxID=1544741 RepID=UPI00166BF497|nr:DUF4190 domain-containing protein [Wenjunlia tyrosinilytica]